MTTSPRSCRAIIDFTLPLRPQPSARNSFLLRNSKLPFSTFRCSYYSRTGTGNSNSKSGQYSIEKGKRYNTRSMTSKLVPKTPSDVMVIRNVTPNIVTLSVPFLRSGMFPIGGRGTIVRLTSGALAVFSPVALTPEVKAKLNEMGGKVGYLVAPDIAHHIFLSEWAAAYPEAVLVGPEGLPEKRQKAGAREPFGVVFKARTKHEVRVGADFDADFDYEYIDAHPNRELVFLYRPEGGGVLVQADLMFNLPAVEQYSRVPEAERSHRAGILGRLFNSLNTPSGDAKSMKRFLWYAISVGNRRGFNDSIRRIAGWDFRTVIPCHGDVLEGNGKEVFLKVFEWHLQDSK